MGSWRKLPSDDLGRELLRNRLRQRFDVFHAGFCVQYLPLAYTRAVRMDDSCIENANRRLLALLSAARPMLVDVRQARDVIPGLGAYDLLHAGPPLVATPERLSKPAFRLSSTRGLHTAQQALARSAQGTDACRWNAFTRLSPPSELNRIFG